MTSEEQQAHSADEQKTADTTQSASEPAAPTLNRAQRRAQAQGKKGASPSSNPANGLNNRFGSGGGRPTNTPAQSRLPRTGHK